MDIILLVIPFAALIPLIAAGISAGGAIGGAALARGQSKRDIQEQNEYNSPINQVNRLREAGLPMAAFGGGTSTGNQSALPIQSGQQVGAGISNFITTQLTLKQLKLLDAQIANTQQEAQSKAIDNQLKQLDPTAGDPVSYGARMQKLDYEMKLIQKSMSENSKQIQDIDLAIKKDLHADGTLSEITRKQLEGLINAVALSKQTLNKGLVMDTIIEKMKNNGMSAFEALLLAFSMNQMSTGSIHFPQISTHQSGDTYEHRNIYIQNKD